MQSRQGKQQEYSDDLFVQGCSADDKLLPTALYGRRSVSAGVPPTYGVLSTP
jgi:hypothetical protein